MKMVVPGSAPVIQTDHSLGTELGRSSTENSMMGPDAETVPDQVGPELEEVKKLQQLVRRLELQNQQLRTRSFRSVPEAKMLSQADAGVDNCSSRLSGMEMNNSINALIDKQELQIVADLHSALNKMRSGAKENDEFLKKDVDGTAEHGCSIGSGKEPSSLKFGNNIEMQNHEDKTDDFSQWDCDTVLVEDFTSAGIERALGMKEGNTNVEDFLNETTLDEVEILELESAGDEEDSWLYVSPRKSSKVEKESPLKWCRQVLDHPSPETEAACRTLISRLDQASRWKPLYCSPLASPSVHNLNADTGSCSNALNSPGHYKSTNKPLLTCGSSGYLGIHSALSSQSSVDSELSTSDDSISMGYKLQDLTDVQVMARLQEESLRQECASSSASVSRRSSSASLHSLRRGTYSDQDFDTYSLEDDDDDCSLSYHSSHRYSPSPLSSPRCQSPCTNTDYGKGAGTRIRPPRRTIKSSVQDRLKYSGNEEDLRNSMPNLTRTGLRSLETVRNSRSLESDLQVPSGRLSRIQPSAGLTPGKLHYSPGAAQSPLTVRQPMKAGSSTNTLLMSRQPVKPAGYINPVGRVRKLQPSTLNAGSSDSGSSVARNNGVTMGAKHSLPKSRTSAGGTSSLKSRLSQPLKSRSPKASISTDDSWKDGCY